MIFASIFLIIVGACMLWKPQFFWSLTERWKSEGATEPSSLYLISIRFGGTLCLLAGIASIAFVGMQG